MQIIFTLLISMLIVTWIMMIFAMLMILDADDHCIDGDLDLEVDGKLVQLLLQAQP